MNDRDLAAWFRDLVVTLTREKRDAERIDAEFLLDGDEFLALFQSKVYGSEYEPMTAHESKTRSDAMAARLRGGRMVAMISPRKS